MSAADVMYLKSLTRLTRLKLSEAVIPKVSNVRATGAEYASVFRHLPNLTAVSIVSPILVEGSFDPALLALSSLRLVDLELLNVTFTDDGIDCVVRQCASLSKLSVSSCRGWTRHMFSGIAAHGLALRELACVTPFAVEVAEGLQELRYGVPLLARLFVNRGAVDRTVAGRQAIEALTRARPWLLLT